MRTGSAAVPLGAGLGDPRQALEEPGDLLDDLGEEAEVVDGVEVADVLPPDDELAHELVAQPLEVRLLAVVVGRERAELVEAGRALRDQIAIDARAVAVLLDQLDLDRARLGDRDLHVDHRRRSPRYMQGASMRGNTWNGPDAEDARPVAAADANRSSTTKTELEQPVLALGPRLLVVAVRHWCHRRVTVVPVAPALPA